MFPFVKETNCFNLLLIGLFGVICDGVIRIRYLQRNMDCTGKKYILVNLKKKQITPKSPPKVKTKICISHPV
jgi:hypothetical protein